MSALIQCTELVCGHGKVPAVRDLNMTVHEGEVVCLLGSNGAGKTTTLSTIAGLLPSIGGSLEVLGTPITGTDPSKISRLGLALVPAGRGLFYRLTVSEYLRLRRHRRSDVTAEYLIETFPILGPIRNRKCGLLSGGEQQIVAIAGALAAKPRIVMLDEMSLGLAPKIVDYLLEVVRGMADERGLGVLLVEQHIAAALSIADRGYVMSHGEVIAQGTATELSAQAHALEASYLGRTAE
jgi:branched-chain amino acid transport system ATP-binding protein